MARKSPKRVRAPRDKAPADNHTTANGLRLWAPWRYQYIRTVGAKDSCIFCFGKLDAAERKRRLILHAGQHAVVMLNRYPYNNGHLMVVPRRHTADFGALPEGELADLHQLLQRSVRLVNESYQPAGMNLGMNLGKAAGAGIADHLHYHLVPRWNGDT